MSEPSVQRTHDALKIALTSYIESQYFIRQRSLFLERRALMEEPGEIEREPFVEATPYYPERDEGFSRLKLSPETIQFLNLAATWEGSGVFPTPFQHQADALVAGLAEGKDVLVASGTGSGKTETFLWTILARAEEEARLRPKSWAKPGFRTLILYPMNALVSDQLGRLRRGFGQSPIRDHFIKEFGRPLRFGMYTSRTPYAGEKTTQKDTNRLGKLIDNYLRISEKQPDLAFRLKEVGRWPAKDLDSFKRNRWIKNQSDAELFSRHEIQSSCPDVLITNYSMLEYMLLRPIEGPIFDQTAAWLASSPENVLTLVVDEAHLYRGTTGAEVGLLLRRLYHRLGANRDQVRCILTSASLGSEQEKHDQIESFAENLVGKGSLGLKVVTAKPLNAAERGRLELSNELIGALGGLDLSVLYQQEAKPSEFSNEIRCLAEAFGQRFSPDHDPKSLPSALGVELTEWAPVSRLISMISGKAAAFQDLADHVFPKHENRNEALERLLALAAVARHPQGGGTRPLVPVRAHLLFRGLPSLFACINPTCGFRRVKEAGPAALGKLHTSPRIQCECGARVFELLAHRDCGMAFLRIYLQEDKKFAWHEGSKVDRAGMQMVLAAVPDKDLVPLVGPKLFQKAWIHIWSGNIERCSPAGKIDEFLPVWLPMEKKKGEPIRWGRCPSCKRGKDQDSITTVSTKGEEPIGALVRTQFEAQAPIRPKERLNPNEGRKLLVFSDGRQAAARLATRLPAEAQREAFREALALALKKGGRTRLNKDMYIGFVGVSAQHHLHFFSGDDQAKLRGHQDKFLDEYNGDLDEAFGIDGDAGLIDSNEEPKGYLSSLLEFLGNPFHSPFDLGILYLLPTKAEMTKLEKSTAPLGLSKSDLISIVAQHIEHLIRSGSVFKTLTYYEKREPLNAFRLRMAEEPKFQESLTDQLREEGISDHNIEELASILFEALCDPPGEGDENRAFHLRHQRISLEFPASESGQLCLQCGRVNLLPFRHRCGRCGSKRLESADPQDPLLNSRRELVQKGVRRALEADRPSLCLSAEEHTAQLSYKDPEEASTTVEDHELRFQGIELVDSRGQKAPPVDVLSCTTTMEVGIDIGSLTAVAMRNVPPRRENYQQRAGRAGRRGSALSTVVTYAQGGSHDAYAFQDPAWLVSGTPATPKTNVRNRTLAIRHINGYLLQAFFRERLKGDQPHQIAPGLSTVYGDTAAFLMGADHEFSLDGFQKWFRELGSSSLQFHAQWLPFPVPEAVELIKSSFDSFSARLSQLRDKQEWVGDASKSTLLDCLFENGWMPRYAFPMDVASLYLFGFSKHQVKVVEKPQQAILVALTEFAPGRILTVDKKDYQVGGLFIPGPTDAKALQDRVTQFMGETKSIVTCPNCTYLRYEDSTPPDGEACPLCSERLTARMALKPTGFTPKGGRPLQSIGAEESYSFSEGAQFPMPESPETLEWLDFNKSIRHLHRSGQNLIAINQGPKLAGFYVCATCGAAEPELVEPKKSHDLPVMTIGVRSCPAPNFQGPYNLFYRFPTDLLAIQMRWFEPLSFSLNDPWWEDALITIVEALRKSASTLLDIDQDELKAGYRLVPEGPTRTPVAELFLYDTAPGGAGYSARAGEELERVFAEAISLLDRCKCAGGCRNCLEYPGNRPFHGRFDRKLASRLLHSAIDGTIPNWLEKEESELLLHPLTKWLEFEGYTKPISIFPFPAGLSPKWVAAQPGCGGKSPISDFDLRNNLPWVIKGVVGSER